MVHRVAVVDLDNCHSRKCGLECIKFCPVNKGGSECIILNDDGKAVISEELCTGCGICVKKCPFEAITIVNLAEQLKEEKIHQFGVNGYRLFRLPIPRKGAVVGLVGKNGVGKSTTIKILSGTLKPNLGYYDAAPDWDKIIEAFKGTELKEYFEKIASKSIKISVKPQAVYLLSKVWKGTGKELLKTYDEKGAADKLAEALNLKEALNKSVSEMSGGECQRLAVAVAASKDAEVYFFDEPSSYNDVYQRMAVAEVIRSLASEGKSVIVAEHDLTLLDYLSDYIHILYGEPGVYGIVSKVQTSRVGINILLDGYIPEENIRFRDRPIKFDTTAPIDKVDAQYPVASYTQIVKNYPGFTLRVDEGEVKKGEVIGILGANALGKSTFLKLIAGVEQPDEGSLTITAKISYKPQYLNSDVDGDVRTLLDKASNGKIDSGLYQSQIIQPLGITKLLDKQVRDLSGGELQKVAIAACLLQDADIYALDEPSAFIDVEDRFILAKAINRFVKAEGKSALVVDHDIQLIDIVSDRLLIFTGKPAVEGRVSPALSKEDGMNLFLKSLGITYRRDVESGRPRVNKPGSKLDRFQKSSGSYYYLARGAAE
ncbi:MAG: ribosome biogenesis/translation initiation ATPase RLI [Nitrososphaerales archaeon]